MTVDNDERECPECGGTDPQGRPHKCPRDERTPWEPRPRHPSARLVAQPDHTRQLERIAKALELIYQRMLRL